MASGYVRFAAEQRALFSLVYGVGLDKKSHYPELWHVYKDVEGMPAPASENAAREISMRQNVSPTPSRPLPMAMRRCSPTNRDRLIRSPSTVLPTRPQARRSP